MSDEKNKKTDEGLQGNEKIESAVAALQKEPSEEMLAHTLTVIRRRMNEKGQLFWRSNHRRVADSSWYRRLRPRTDRPGGRRLPALRKK